MLVRINNGRFTSLFWCLVLVQLLNVSVDPPDLVVIDLPEDLSFNDPESIVEIIAEHILGYEDAFPEYDDNDSDKEGRSHKTLQLDTFPPYRVDLRDTLSPGGDRQARSSLAGRLLILQHYLEISSPPPEA